MYHITTVVLYLICFCIALYATSSIKFERFIETKNPTKVQLLWLLITISIAYLTANFFQIMLRI